MPRLLLPLVDKHNSVVRPIITSVVQELFELTHINPKTTIYYPGETEHSKQHNSAMGDAELPNRFGADDFVHVEVRTQAIEDLILTNSADRVGEQFTFFDDSLQIFARPARTFSSAEITVRYRAKSKADAQRWIDDMKNKVAQGRASLIHSPISYSYDVPAVAMAIYHELHRLRENKYGDGTNFNDWFLDRSSHFVSVITNRAGSEASSAYAVSETLERIQGAFDFPVAPEAGQYAEGLTAWETSFTYTIQLDIVEGYVMLYPVSVHNQLVPQEFIDYKTVYQRTNHLQGWSAGQTYTHTFESQYVMKRYVDNVGILIPEWDDFSAANYPGMWPVLTVLLQLYDPDQGDVQELLDWTQLGKRKLAPYMVEFFKSEARFLTKRYLSPFFLSYHRGFKTLWEGDDIIHATHTGKVMSKYPFDPKLVHHLRLNVVHDMDLLNRRALEALAENACVLRAYMHAISPSFDLSKIKSRRGICGPVAFGTIDNIIEDIARDRSKIKLPARGIKTVGAYSVEAFFTEPDELFVDAQPIIS